MEAYVNEVLNNKKVVTLEKTKNYYLAKHQVSNELGASELDINGIENVSKMEETIYNYLKMQDIELLVSVDKYTTCLVNMPHYKAISLEYHYLDSENDTKRLIALSHELGHYLDVKFNHKNDAERFNIVYNHDEKNMQIMELVAWLYGWNVLVELGFEDKQTFLCEMAECLTSYTGNLNKTKDMMKKANLIVKQYESEMAKMWEMVVE